MGYGLLMILGCLVVLKVKRPSNRAFWELFLWCGVATFIWGIFTAGFFGDAPTQIYLMSHDALPEGMSLWWFWQPMIDPLNKALELLIGSLALGVIQIFTGMAVSIYMKCKRGEVMSAIMDEVAWYLIFIVGAVGILTNNLKIALIVIAVIVVISGAWGK
jgi:V/A-type H+-transporting ATPase subunit I